MPPAPANDSQGLKIATILLGILSFILAISTYFGFSNASVADEKATKVEKELSDYKNNTVAKVQRTFEMLKLQAGYDKAVADDDEGLKAAIVKDKAELDKKVTASFEAVSALVQQVQKQGGDRQVGDLLQASAKARDLVINEPNQSLRSKLERSIDLMKNLSMLTSALALDNLAIRKDLEQVNSINDAKVKAAEAAAQKSNDDLRDFIATNEDARKSDLAKLEEVEGARRLIASKLDETSLQLDQNAEAYKKETAERLRLIKNLKLDADKKDIKLDVADGKVTFADYRRNEVRVNLTRSQGIRPMMRFAIFDKDAQGLPTDKPKASIKITGVGDRDSVGVIENPGNEFDRAYQIAHPIYAGDQVYSAVWSPNDPKRIALVGKIDINRDSIDDRAELKRLIEQAGGVVEFDLPPPAKGKRYGTPSGNFTYYVIDERAPLVGGDAEENTEEMKKYNEEKAATMQAFNEAGVQPMPVDRLLGILGYSFGMARPGQTEAFSQGAYEKLLFPQGRGKSATDKKTDADSGSTASPDQR